MDKSIKILTDVVKKQKLIYEELYELAKSKQSAVERGDTGELDFVVKAEEILVMTLGKLEKERNNIISETALKNNIAQENLTVKNWPDASENERNELLSLQNDFLITLNNIDVINQTNQKLISIQLEYVKHVLESTDTKVKSNSYSNTGIIKKIKSDEAKIVDIRM